MFNQVKKIFSDMSNEELSQVIQEMKEDGPQGIIREGIVREKCKMVQDMVGGNTYEHLLMVQFSILQEAAYRFTPTMDISENHKIDLSWMWHCSDNPKNVLDYTELVKDSKIAESLNKAAAMGFRSALRRIEELHIIQMGDIDRNPNDSDQLKWSTSFSTNSIT